MRPLVGLMLVCIASAGNAQMVKLRGAGAGTSCGTWVYERTNRIDGHLGTWVLGFISGAEVFGSVGNPFGKVDAQGLFYWLDNYCRANPSLPLVDALDAFMTIHGRR